MRIPGNCLIAALIAKGIAPRRTRLRYLRNRCGRLHFYWERDGRRFEFYTQGASRASYLRNAIRLGEVREIGVRQ